MERGHYRRQKGGVNFTRHVYITEHGLGRPVCDWGVKTGFWGILRRRRGMDGVFKKKTQLSRSDGKNDRC